MGHAKDPRIAASAVGLGLYEDTDSDGELSEEELRATPLAGPAVD